MSPERSCLFICDIQDKFRPLIHNMETVIKGSTFLYKIADTLKIPTMVTEQYPKALGYTVPDIGLKPEVPKFEKKQFSMMTPEFKTHFDSLGKDQVILVGIEAHVCIMQTALDLLDNNVDVHLVLDAVSSQRPYDRTVAIQRLLHEGVTISTAEATVMDLCKTASHPDFRAISGLLKDHNLLENQFLNQETL